MHSCDTKSTKNIVALACTLRGRRKEKRGMKNMTEPVRRPLSGKEEQAVVREWNE